jgi:hypothetical protein
MLLFATITTFSCFLPLTVLLLRWRNAGGPEHDSLWYFVAYAASAGLQWLVPHFGFHNWWVSSLDYVIGLVVVFLLFRLWEPLPTMRTLFLVTAAAYAIFWIVAKLFWEHFAGPSPYTGPVSNLLIGLGAARILQSLIEGVGVPLYRTSQFWIIGGILFNAANDLLITAVVPMVLDFSTIDQDLFFGLHWSRVILVNVVFAGALWWCRTPVQISGGRS